MGNPRILSPSAGTLTGTIKRVRGMMKEHSYKNKKITIQSVSNGYIMNVPSNIIGDETKIYSTLTEVFNQIAYSYGCLEIGENIKVVSNRKSINYALENARPLLAKIDEECDV